MFVLTPVSAIHSGYPSCPTYNYERAAEAAVQRAAYDYAVAQARAEAIRQQRADEERRYREAVLREQARRAEAVQLFEALHEQEHPFYYENTYSLIDAERYRRRSELDAAHRRAELLRQRQHAERARAAVAARRRAEVEHLREARRREQEQWISLLATQFGGAAISQKSEAAPAPAESTPENSQPEPRPVNSELKRRLQSEEDDEVREALQHLLFQLGGSAPASKKAKVDKGKARETPAIPFNLPKSKPETTASSSSPLSFTVPVTAPSSAPAKPEAVPANQGADLHRTPAMTPAQAQEAKERLEDAHARALSLGTIKRIEDTLSTLQSSFVFPIDLDLARPESPSGWDSDSEAELAFTPKNKPVHVYEYALSGLLSKLDAVDSFGDEAIRGRRKEVVNKVEKALREIGKRVEESRERARTPQEPLTEDAIVVPIQDAAQEKAEVDAAPVSVEASVPVESTVISDTDVSPAPAESSAVLEAEPLEIAMQDTESTPSVDTIPEPVSEVDVEPVKAALGDDATSATEESAPELAIEHAPADAAQSAPSDDHVPEDAIETTPERAETSMDVDAPAVIENAAIQSETVAPQPAETETSPSDDTAAVANLSSVMDTIESSPSTAPSSLMPSEDTFLPQSNPIPDPASHKSVSDEPTAAEKADDDLEIVESDEAAEVLGELNEAEWSDVGEAH